MVTNFMLLKHFFLSKMQKAGNKIHLMEIASCIMCDNIVERGLTFKQLLTLWSKTLCVYMCY